MPLQGGSLIRSEKFLVGAVPTTIPCVSNSPKRQLTEKILILLYFWKLYFFKEIVAVHTLPNY